MDLLTALATIEKVLLDIVTDSEQRAASSIGRCVDTIRTSNAARNGGDDNLRSSQGSESREKLEGYRG
jgi:hypothetical protein